MFAALLAMTISVPIDLPRIKGDPMKAWHGEGLSIVAMSGKGPDLRPYHEFGATARIGWNDEGLLAQVEVSDATPFSAPDPSRPYDGDSVELYLGIPGEQNMVQLVASAAGNRFFDYRKPELRDHAPLEGKSTLERTSNGYVVRALINWSSMGMRPKIGLNVGARLGINDGAPGPERDGLTWQSGEFFFALPEVRLAEEGGRSPELAVWSAAQSDLRGHVVNVVAETARAGQKVRFAGREATLKSDGPRAVARFEIAVPAGGVTPRGTVTVEGGPETPVALPDLLELRKRAFERRAGAFKAGFPRTVFEGSALPKFRFGDDRAAERLVGPIEINADYYDVKGQRVERADVDGRYGAVVRLRSEFGGDATFYQTLFRGTSSDGALDAAAGAEGKGDPEKADRDWWHALRKRLGSAIHYETYLKFPREKAGEKWPLIVYLHGSGGGDASVWETVKRADGPMGPAHAKSDFPFAVLALRSPGGWYPPAVKDAIDEAIAGGNIDENRIILTGFSMGAMGTWSVAYDEPDRFAAIVPVGGRRGDPTRMSLLKNVPAWVFNGESDEATLASDARAAVESLRTAGGNVQYTEIPKASHVDSLRIAYAKRELYDWMAKQKRSHP